MPRPPAHSRLPFGAPPIGSNALGDELLVALAEVIDTGLSLRSGEPARIIRVRTAPSAVDVLAGGDGNEVELGLRALDDGQHPLEALVGFSAPPDWAAIGVAATGRAVPVDGQAPFAVRSVHLVARHGGWASRWAALDGSNHSTDDRGAASSGTAPALPTGRVDDALRRCLGITTPPPPGDTRRLWAVQWLDTLVAAGASSPSRRRRLRPLRALVAAHPAVGAFDLDPDATDLEQLVASGDRLATWRDWHRLRRACAAGTWSHPEVDAATAAWLDDGAFARWVLAGWPELVDLHEAAAALLAPSAMSVIDDALAGWDLRHALERPPHAEPVPESDELPH